MTRTTGMNGQWLLAARPHGLVKESDFEYVESEIPKALDGTLVVRNLYLSFDPTMRGGISRYNDEKPAPGPANYMNLVIQRARMEGFIIIDYFPRFAEGAAELGGWLGEGQLVYAEDLQQGFENVPKTFLRLFSGANLGKQLIQITDPPIG